MSDNTRASSRCSCNHAIMLGACCCAIGALVPVTLYQLGTIKSLPDPPFRIFDSERITTSKAAHPFGIPDGILGLASFTATLALILLAKKHKPAKTLLGAKLALDASAAAFNASRQVIGFGKLCSWCTATAISAGVMACAGRSVMSQSLEFARNTVSESASTSGSASTG